MDAPGENRARDDGALHYRVDGTGARIAVLPAHCRQGRHSHAATGYRAYYPRGGGLAVECAACVRERRPEHSWRLRVNGPAPDRAELDDGPYLDVEMSYGARPRDWPARQPYRDVLARQAEPAGSGRHRTAAGA